MRSTNTHGRSGTIEPHSHGLSENPRKILVELRATEGETATTSHLAEWIGETTNNTGKHCRENLEGRYVERAGTGESTHEHLHPPVKWRLTDEGRELADQLADGTVGDSRAAERARLKQEVETLTQRNEELTERVERLETQLSKTVEYIDNNL